MEIDVRYYLSGIALAGLAGSLALLVILQIVPPLIFARGLDILVLLGTYFTTGGWALGIGALLFLAMGQAAAAAYAGLWLVRIGRPSPRIGLLFGFGHGLVSIAALQILYALNPDPPAVYMTGPKSFAVLLGHLAFGLLVATIYRPFAARAESERRRESA